MSNLSDRNKKSKKSVKSGSKKSAYASISDVTPLSTHPNAHTANVGATPDTNGKLKRWSFIQNDLEKALDTWEELEKGDVILSPEEEQLQKIKTIIGQLKDKLNQF
ncbi:MAG: hypothetical protein H7328_07455 [Bdellovibrio sp.]|nr:hypothetical protein [Bdellovibrio sp.]